MNAALINESRRSATLIYTNPHSGVRLDDKNAKYSFLEVAEFLSQFTQPDISLIATMPSGLGLDFYSEEDGIIWVEFYGDVLQSTFVDLAASQKILERAFSSEGLKPVSGVFSDIVQKWEY